MLDLVLAVEDGGIRASVRGCEGRDREPGNKKWCTVFSFVSVSTVCYRICNSVSHLLHNLARDMLGCSAGRSRDRAPDRRIPAVEGDPPVVTPPT